jgi:hypothetical protein
MALTKTPIELSSTPGIVDNSNATAITIDSSENVTLAGTATAVGLTVTSSSSNAGTFKAVGGYAVQAYQDATSANHTALELRSDHVSGGTDRYLIRGYNTAAGTPAESFNVNTAGGAYFAGGVYLGGTAAANKLEDYEEGTWTPTDASGEGYSLTVNSATYTKIGRLVYITVYIDYPAQSSSAAQLNGGLPFPSMSGTTYPQLTARVIDDTVSAQNLTFQITTNSTEGGVLDGLARITNAELSGKGVLYTGCYQTA